MLDKIVKMKKKESKKNKSKKRKEKARVRFSLEEKEKMMQHPDMIKAVDFIKSHKKTSEVVIKSLPYFKNLSKKEEKRKK